MAASAPTVSDISRIAALTDPVLRNLRITHAYHQLAGVLAERVGMEANWCVYATWASKQAGQTIRKQDLVRTLEMYLGEQGRNLGAEQLVDAARRVGVWLDRKRLFHLLLKGVDPEGAFAHASDAVGRGNLKVFAEIGHEFARFHAACLPDTSFHEATITSFVEALHPGPPPDGQEMLRQAFRAYYQALFEPDQKVRSELLFLANLQIGFHEQTRLQPEINEALEAPVLTPHDFARNLLHAYYPTAGWLANLLSTALHKAGSLIGFDSLATRYVAGARRQAQRIVTDTMMTIEIPPHTQLRLGQDLPANFPPVLQQIASPALTALLAQVDPTPDSLQESGAVYWGDLNDRLHFISDMFRCYHMSRELLTPPFLPSQILAFEEGRLPEGPL